MNEIINHIGEVIKERYDYTVERLPIERPANPEHGDFSTNVSFEIAAEVNQPPRKIAESIVADLAERNLSEITSANVAGPGFINLILNNTFLLSLLNRQAAKPYEGSTVVIETNNPNPFKDIHIGHAYNAIVSDTIANLLEVGGANVHRVSYHGDVGLHVGKSLWAIKNALGGEMTKKLEVIKPEDRPTKLRDWYVTGAKAYEDSEAAKAEIETITKHSFELDENDELRAAYELCKKWSFNYFEIAFGEIGCKPVERRYLESETNKEGRQTVEDHIGDIFEYSDGAVIFPGKKYGLHTRVFIASRGTTLYEARDLGLMLLKERDYHPDKSYIVTAVEQDQYFKVIFKAASLVLKDLAGKTENIATGTVKLKTGKMSSRTGDVVNIAWLTDTLRKAVIERGADEDTADQVMVAALRYSFLKNRLNSDTVFDIDQSISVEGNTGPYLQYAHARAMSILKKSKQSPNTITADGLTDDERIIITRLTMFPETIDRSVVQLMPHFISTYLYELCKDFNSFYEKNRIIGDPREAVRIALVSKYVETLKNGLSILGIEAPDSM